MEPDLEVVQMRPGESFAAWPHGYPYRTVRWHFHPEYELHLAVATSGRYFVGEFEPGNLVLTGPNLPHSRVSNLPKDGSVPLRCRIIPFSGASIDVAISALPELALEPVLESSRRGEILVSDVQASITSVRCGVGCNSLSNFNRQFLAEKGMTPSRFRRLPLDNVHTAKAA